jgi:hypothetical protein
MILSPNCDGGVQDGGLRDGGVRMDVPEAGGASKAKDPQGIAYGLVVYTFKGRKVCTR